MSKPVTAQQLVDWIKGFQSDPDEFRFEEAVAILNACCAFLEALEKKPETVTAWAWEFDGMLCEWAEPYRVNLTDENKPVDNAKRVCVRIIRNKDWLRLRK